MHANWIPLARANIDQQRLTNIIRNEEIMEGWWGGGGDGFVWESLYVGAEDTLLEAALLM
jgi:hypothetical protein